MQVGMLRFFTYTSYYHHTHIMRQNSLQAARLASAMLLSLAFGIAPAAEGPPSSNGVIANPTLVANQAIAKAQAVGAITTFMSKGTTSCDEKGQNCKSLFGSDDQMDYTSTQLKAEGITGVQSFSFMSGDSSADQMDSNTIATQTGSLVLACGNTDTQVVSGIAVKLTSCFVNSNGDAQIKFQVCSAPVRGNPIKPPEKVMVCSKDPKDPNFRPQVGYACQKPTCDTEPMGSLNGWSAPMTVSYSQATATSGSEDAKAKNGLGLVFYPALSGGITPSYSADSDNMTAVKIVQTAISKELNATAVGMRVAFRYKTKVTKEMISQGTSSVPTPTDHSSSWETIEKLNNNALIPQYQATYAKNGSECLQQIQGGLATDGVVSVCDRNYTNESGIKPDALTAKIATDGQDCGTTAQCLAKVVNTNTWDQTCQADVPLSIRNCTTTQDYTIEQLHYTRTRTEEQCTEARSKTMHACMTTAVPELCTKESLITQGGVDINSTSGDSSVILERMVDANTGQYRIGAVGDNYWSNGYFKREFIIDILDAEHVKEFRMYSVGYDDEMAVAVNNNWVWSEYDGGSYNPSTDTWGRWVDNCEVWVWEGQGGSHCEKWVKVWETAWERSRSQSYPVSVDLRPYLKTGRNIIRMDTGVSGNGEGWVFLQISAWRAKCEMRLNNECSGYEAAK